MNFDGYVVIREVSLPSGIHGAIREDPDGIANIYLNESDSEEEKRRTLNHEMRHYQKGHLGSEKPISTIEEEAEEAI